MFKGELFICIQLFLPPFLFNPYKNVLLGIEQLLFITECIPRIDPWLSLTVQEYHLYWPSPIVGWGERYFYYLLFLN